VGQVQLKDAQKVFLHSEEFVAKRNPPIQGGRRKMEGQDDGICCLRQCWWERRCDAKCGGSVSDDG